MKRRNRKPSAWREREGSDVLLSVWKQVLSYYFVDITLEINIFSPLTHSSSCFFMEKDGKRYGRIFREMKVSITLVQQILQDATVKAQTTLDHAGMRVLSEKINHQRGDELITQRYLYENLHTRVGQLSRLGKTEIGVSEAYLNIVLGYLGFASLRTYQQSKRPSAPKQLLSCTGHWQAYVRCNSGRDELLVNPFEVVLEGGRVIGKLNGPHRTYTGELRLNNGCVFALLDSGEGKELHWVLRIGLAYSPGILQGTFSGMSSAGIPVAGRLILQKKEINGTASKPYRVILGSVGQAEGQVDPRIAKYLGSFANNYVRVVHFGSFDLSDLAQDPYSK